MPGMDMPDTGAGPARAHDGQGTADPAQSESFTCRMHSQIAAKAPGSCPICGMPLVKKTASKPQERQR